MPGHLHVPAHAISLAHFSVWHDILYLNRTPFCCHSQGPTHIPALSVTFATCPLMLSCVSGPIAEFCWISPLCCRGHKHHSCQTCHSVGSPWGGERMCINQYCAKRWSIWCWVLWHSSLLGGSGVPHHLHSGGRSGTDNNYLTTFRHLRPPFLP